MQAGTSGIPSQMRWSEGSVLARSGSHSSPFTYAHEHFGYHDRLSEPPHQRGGGEPNSAALVQRLMLENFFSASFRNRKRASPPVFRNREFFRAMAAISRIIAPTPTSAHFETSCGNMARHRRRQEWIAAKPLGRWRSGAPLVLAPDKDDPELGGDMSRTNDFNYAKMDPYGYGCPLGSHIRRMNPRR